MRIALNKIIKNSYIKKIKKLKSYQRFRSEKHNLSTEEVNKTPFSSNNDKRIQ